jgi:hypothetical protein
MLYSPFFVSFVTSFSGVRSHTRSICFFLSLMPCFHVTTLSPSYPRLHGRSSGGFLILRAGPWGVLILVYELGLAALPGAVCTNVHDAVEFEGSLPRNFFQRWSTFSIRLTNDFVLFSPLYDS